MKPLAALLLSGIGVFAQQVDAVRQIQNLPYLDSRAHNWSRVNAKSASGTISAGSSTVTLTPVPRGVNGANQSYFVRVSGGVGSAEQCAVTGGTAVSQAASGTVIMTCANSHSGSWSIGSATSGIQEAVQAASSAGGGTVIVSNATHEVRAHVLLPSNVELLGYGSASVIKIPDNALTAAPAWELPGAPGTYSMIATTSGASNVKVRDLTLDTNGVNQTSIGGYGVIAAYPVQYITISGNRFINGLSGHSNGGVALFFSSADSIISNNYFLGRAGCGTGLGPNAVFVQGFRHKIHNNYATNMCDEVFVANGNFDTVFSNNQFDYGGSSMGSSYAVFHAENSKRTSMIGNTCNGSGSLPTCYLASPIGVSGGTVEDVTISGNIAKNANRGIALGATDSSGFTTKRVAITGNTVSECGLGILIYGPVESATVSGNTITSNTSVGVNVFAQATGNIKTLVITGNVIDHNGGAGTLDSGIQLAHESGGAAVPVDMLIISDNFIGDTGASKVQDYGILVVGTPAATGWTITNNQMVGNNTASLLFPGTLTWGRLGPNYDGTVGSGRTVDVSQGAAFELGATNASNLPFIDFHSSGNGNDYDSRIIASGGGAPAGIGDLQLRAETVTISKYLFMEGTTHSSLGTTNKMLTVCTDCAVTSGADNTCASGGTGALAVRLNGVWRCFVAQN